VEELDLSDDEMKDGVDTVQVVNKKSRRKSALRDSTSSSSSSHNICQAFAQGRCEQGNKCRLKHLVMSNASSDIRFRPQMHQAQPNGRVCYDFEISGRCRFGDRCQFEHHATNEYSAHDNAGFRYQVHGQPAGSHSSSYYADRYRYSQDHAYGMDSRYGSPDRHLSAWEALRGSPPPLPVPRQARSTVLPITLPVGSRDPLLGVWPSSAPRGVHEKMVVTYEVPAHKVGCIAIFQIMHEAYVGSQKCCVGSPMRLRHEFCHASVKIGSHSETCAAEHAILQAMMLLLESATAKHS